MARRYSMGELEGSQLYFLLDLVLRGKHYRFSSEPVDVANAATPDLPALMAFGGGLEPVEVAPDVEPFGGGELERSVSIALRFTDDQVDGWAALAAADQDIGDATAELSMWRLGDDWADRETIISGAVDAADYGTASEPVDIQLTQSVAYVNTVYPPTGSDVREETWPLGTTLDHALDENRTEEIYQVVIGTPGRFRADDPDNFVQPTVAADRFRDWAGVPLILGQISAAQRYNAVVDGVAVLGVGAMSCEGEDVECVNVTAGTLSLLPATVTQDREGRVITVLTAEVESTQTPNPDLMRWTEGDEIWARFTDSGFGGIRRETYTATTGGQGPITGAGEVIDWLMLQAGIPYDRDGSRTALERVNAFRFDFYWNTYQKTWELIENDLLPLLPLGWEFGPAGVRFVYWDLEATKADRTFEVNPEIYGGERNSAVSRSSIDEVWNEFRLDYWWEPIAGKQERALTVGPQDDREVEEFYQVDPFAQLSASRYGVKAAEPFPTEVVQETATARAILSYWVRLRGVTHETVSYLLPQRYQAIRPGDIGTITDSTIGWVDRVVLAGAPIRVPGSTVITFRTVPNFVRDAPVSPVAAAVDGFVVEAESNASLLGVWTPASLGNGVISSAGNAMVDQSEKGAPDLVHTNTGTGSGTWSVIGTDGPGNVASLKKCVEMTRQGPGNGSNAAYAQVSSALSSGAKSGVCFFKVPGGSWTAGQVGIFGISDGTDLLGGGEHHFRAFGGESVFHFWTDGASDAGTTLTAGSKWIAVSFRKTVDSDPGKATLAVTDLSVAAASRALGDLLTAVEDSSTHAWSATVNDGLHIGLGAAGATFPNTAVRHGAIVLFSDDIGDTKLLSLLKAAT